MMTVHYSRNQRCFFAPFNASNDINPKTKKAGIATYRGRSALLLFFASLFGRVVRYRDYTGKEHLLNKGSFKKWLVRHGENPTFRKMADINKKVFKILMRERQEDLDFKNLPDSQFDRLFNKNSYLGDSAPFRDRIQQLSKEQVNQTVNRFSDDSLGLLSDSQIQGLDLKLLRKEQFDKLFTHSWDDKCQRRVQLLTPKQVQDHIEHLGFKSLSKEQIQKLDLSRINPKKLNDLLYNTVYCRTPSPIQLLSQKQFNENAHRFDDRILDKASKSQVMVFIPLMSTSLFSDKQLQSLFDSYTLTASERKERVALLSLDQILDGLPNFSEGMMSHLTNTQIQGLDIKKIIQRGLLRKLFDGFYIRGVYEKRVRKLSDQQIRENYKDFTGNILDSLDEGQVARLIPFLDKLTHAQFKVLFRDGFSVRNRTRIQLLRVEQIQAFLEHFDSLGNLTDEQLKGLNTTGIDEHLKYKILLERHKRFGEPAPDPSSKPKDSYKGWSSHSTGGSSSSGSSRSTGGSSSGSSYSTGGSYHFGNPFLPSDPFNKIKPIEDLAISPAAGELHQVYIQIRNGELKKLLNLGNPFTERELNVGYKKLALKLHPDKNPQHRESAGQLIAYINNAMDELRLYASPSNSSIS
jgi:hypothetical protein